MAHNRIPCPSCPGTMDKRSTKCANCNEARGLLVDLTDQRFGRLTAIRRSQVRRGKGERTWECLCDCGGTVHTTIHQLRSGGTASCGCRNAPWTHGESRSAEYISWRAMHLRCEDQSSPDWKNYGGRGITVCERWADVTMFIADMGRRPSPTHMLDRIDNDRGYSPENCRWATRSEQMRNRRNSHFLTYNGETLTIAAWTERLGFPSAVISKRIKRGWPIDKALTLPLGSPKGAWRE